MNELLKINYEAEQPTVSARDLHEQLHIGTPEVVDMYNTVAARIYDKIAKHLDGSDPFPTDELIYAKKINNFVDELGEACEQILRAVME